MSREQSRTGLRHKQRDICPRFGLTQVRQQPPRSPAPSSPRPRPIRRYLPSSGLRAFEEGHSPGRPATYNRAAGESWGGGKQRWMQRARARCGGEGSSLPGAPGRGGQSSEEMEREQRRGSRAVSSSPLPPGRDRARGAAPGRGQLFFVSRSYQLDTTAAAPIRVAVGPAVLFKI